MINRLSVNAVKKKLEKLKNRTVENQNKLKIGHTKFRVNVNSEKRRVG